MPKGELRPERKTVLVSATPSPLESRSRVMRLGVGTAAPAFFIACPMKKPRMPLPSSGRSGALVSATSTSPLGRTCSQRGWSSPVAKACTLSPGAAVGDPPPLQPTASAIFSVGNSGVSGFSSTGIGPIAMLTGVLAGDAHEASTATAAPARSEKPRDMKGLLERPDPSDLLQE